MKICNNCKQSKTLDLFWKNGKNQYKHTCKDCMSLKRKGKLKTFELDTSIILKECTKCKQTKNISLFNKDKYSIGGYAKQCTQCKSVKNKNLYKINKDIKKEQSKTYYHSNKKEIIKKQSINQKEKLKTDHVFAMTRRLRNRLWYALKNKNWKKTTEFSKYIGCSYSELMIHIENQFEPGMTWENKSLWHIDHIIPLASAKTEEELYKLCHYTNLQPMWAKDNLSKGAKLESKLSN